MVKFLDRAVFQIAFIIGMLFFGVFSSGCISQHTSEINQVTSYIRSANSRLVFLSPVDYETVWVGNIKANASAAKSDLTEALKILNNIPLSDLNSQDQANLQGLRVMINVDLEMCDLLQGSLSDFIENSQTYARTKDPGIETHSMNEMKVSLNNMKSSAGQMIDEMNSVNENDLSPKVRSDFIYLKSMTQSIQETLNKLSNTLENVCTVKCNSGYVLGKDCQCHQACGDTYCSEGSLCCNNTCYISSGSDYQIDKLTCISYPIGSTRCGVGYCKSPNICCKSKCYIPPDPGYFFNPSTCTQTQYQSSTTYPTFTTYPTYSAYLYRNSPNCMSVCVLEYSYDFCKSFCN